MKNERSAIVIVFAVSFVLLFMEMIEPKLFQFMRIYGHELFVVAVTMLGMGIGGLACYSRKGSSESSMLAALVILPLSILAAFFSIATGMNRYAVTLVCAAPYFLISLIISHAFIRFPSFRVYFANLLGSGLGVLAVYFFLPFAGGETSMFMCAGMAALASASFVAFADTGIFKKLTAAAALALCAALLFIQINTNRFDVLRMCPDSVIPETGPLVLATRASRINGAEVLDTRWNMISRIDIIRTPGNSMKQLLFPEGAEGVAHEGLKKEIEESFGAEVHMYSNNVYASSLAVSPRLFTGSPPYTFLERPRVLVIGVGGGMDLAKARYHEPRRLVGVEINPGVAASLAGPLAKESGGTYLESEIMVMDGRTFAHYSKSEFDLINLVFADLYIPFYNSNVYLESYLYTREAFMDYLNILSDKGYLAITKMIGTIRSPLELMRITSTLLEAAEYAGIEEPEKHIAILGFSSGKDKQLAGTVLFKKIPFSQEEIASLLYFARPPYIKIFVPGTENSDNPFSRLIKSEDRESLLAGLPYDVSPTTDNRPFFYQFDRSLVLHKTTLLFFVCLTAIIFFAPYFIIISGREKRGNPAYWIGTAYFALLAAAYMFLESALVQKFNLYLGGGLYSLTLVVSCLLIFAGLGSRLGEAIGPRLGPWTVWAAPVMVLAYFPLAERIADILPGGSITARLLYAACLLAPLCLSLGLPFPWALQEVKRRTEDRAAALMYGLNATMGVLAVAASLWLSAKFGLAFLYAAAVALYIVVGLFALLMRESPGE